MNWLKRIFSLRSAELESVNQKEKMRFRRDIYTPNRRRLKRVVEIPTWDSEIAYFPKNDLPWKTPYKINAYTHNRFYMFKENFYIILHHGKLTFEEKFFHDYILKDCPYFLGYLVKDKVFNRYHLVKKDQQVAC
jgi:hypothetical protein